MPPRPPTSTLFPYTTLFRSTMTGPVGGPPPKVETSLGKLGPSPGAGGLPVVGRNDPCRSEEHTSELQSQSNLVCRLLLEKKKKHHRQCSDARHDWERLSGRM